MELLIPILIYLVVPVLGLQFFIWFKKQLRQKQKLTFSTIELLLLFITYGGWGLVILTGLFWYWSGMATVGLFYLIAIAPFIMCFLAWRLYEQRKESTFHFRLFLACAGYLLVSPVGVLALFLFNYFRRQNYL